VNPLINLIALVQNETIKILMKRRFLVIVLILAALIPLITYGQLREAENIAKKTGYADWRTTTIQQINNLRNRLSSSNAPEEFKKFTYAQINLSQYYLDKNVEPNPKSAANFTRGFIERTSTLFIPLLVIIVAADMVSAEHASGTIKLLLSRPISRFRILLSKWIALVFFVSMVIVLAGSMAYLVSGLFIGYGGWDANIITGIVNNGAQADFSNAHLLSYAEYTFMQYGFAWFVSLIIATLTFMVSVLVRSTAATMGIMISLNIVGLILANLVNSWESLKYLFMVNLSMTNYLAGVPMPIEGMTLPFSMTVMGIWGVGALIVAFTVFVRKDILN
jgi:ABC-2 type transport system permease protein